MGNLSLVPEAVLQLFHAFVYCMAYICVGWAVIALCVYIVLVCSETFSQPRSKIYRDKGRESARRVSVDDETLDLSAAETPILAEPTPPPPRGAQTPMTVPANLESEPTWP